MAQISCILEMQILLMKKFIVDATVRSERFFQWQNKSMNIEAGMREHLISNSMPFQNPFENYDISICFGDNCKKLYPSLFAMVLCL